LKIVVAVKQVAVLGDEVEFTEDERDVDPDYLDFALNEWGLVRDRGGRFASSRRRLRRSVVVSVGDEDAEDAMRRCLAMGADRGIRVRGRGGLDPIQVAARLAEVVQSESPDLVFAGVQSSDSVQAATGGRSRAPRHAGGRSRDEDRARRREGDGQPRARGRARWT
jgi:electron transfer flavoprotein beta subunit